MKKESPSTIFATDFIKWVASLPKGSQRLLSNTLGVNEGTISKWANKKEGDNGLTAEKHILQAFKRSADHVWLRVGSPFPDPYDMRDHWHRTSRYIDAQFRRRADNLSRKKSKSIMEWSEDDWYFFNKVYSTFKVFFENTINCMGCKIPNHPTIDKINLEWYYSKTPNIYYKIWWKHSDFFTAIRHQAVYAIQSRRLWQFNPN